MTSHLTAAYYADRARCETVEVQQNERIAHDTYRLRFASAEIARRITPGQFVMMRLSGSDDPLLGRPLALYDTVFVANSPAAIEVVYLVVGKMTARLADLRTGDRLEVWGPLGNGFAATSCQHLLMVAGGIGQTPFLALAREQLGRRSYGISPRDVRPAPRVTLCYGVRQRKYLAGLADFENLGVEVRISTDDGSAGHHGLVTDLVEQALDGPEGVRLVCCGPEPMMAAVSRLAVARGAACEVSLETPMACGIGICFSCVARVRDDQGEWDYRRTCVEGPVFDAAQIEW